MRKVFRLEDLDCANCAAKMETAIASLPGVNKATVSFMAQKLVLDADDASFDVILAQAEKLIKKVDADCRLVK
ncbi:MAG: cation transporter [Clostridia bacterium]|nr:cation transporter [Clostridia bacterium]